MIDGQLDPSLIGVCWSMSHDDVACDKPGTVFRYRGKPQRCGIGSAGALKGKERDTVR
jgi:hypothetical protein